MKEEVVSYETALLAKEKGYSQNPYKVPEAYLPKYTDGSCIYKGSSLYSPENNICTAPTQNLLQKWLRKEYGIHIEIECMKILNPDYELYIYYRYGRKQYYGSEGESRFETYEKALEAGLKESLKLI